MKPSWLWFSFSLFETKIGCGESDKSVGMKNLFAHINKHKIIKDERSNPKYNWMQLEQNWILIQACRQDFSWRGVCVCVEVNTQRTQANC